MKTKYIMKIAGLLAAISVASLSLISCDDSSSSETTSTVTNSGSTNFAIPDDHSVEFVEFDILDSYTITIQSTSGNGLGDTVALDYDEGDTVIVKITEYYVKYGNYVYDLTDPPIDSIATSYSIEHPNASSGSLSIDEENRIVEISFEIEGSDTPEVTIGQY